MCQKLEKGEDWVKVFIEKASQRDAWTWNLEIFWSLTKLQKTFEIDKNSTAQKKFSKNLTAPKNSEQILQLKKNPEKNSKKILERERNPE